MRIERKRSRNPLRYGFYLILVLFAGFIIAGLLTSSLTIETLIKIEKPSAEIIPYLSQPELLSKWIGEVKSTEIVQGEYGKEGSTYKISYKDGQITYATFQAIDNEDLNYQYLIESDITNTNISIQLNTLPDGSVDISQQSSIESKDILTGSILLFLKNMYTKEFNSNLEKLKHEVENS